MSDPAEAIYALLESPGWAAFRSHVEQEWGPSGTRFESTLNTFADSREDDALVLQQIRQIAVARREILRLLSWPHEEAARLKQAKAQPDPSVRKALPLALAGQGRRGGL